MTDDGVAVPVATGVAPVTPRRTRSRRGQGERLREDILAAAGRVLAQTGELSLRAVAREVGIATTSIYLHFSGLDDLVLAVRLRYLSDMREALAAAAGTAGMAGIRAWAHAYVGYGLSHRDRYWIIFAAENLPAHLIPEVVGPGVRAFNALRDDIAAAVGTGEDTTMLALHLWTALHGIVTLRTVRYGFPWPDVTREVDDLIDRLMPA